MNKYQTGKLLLIVILLLYVTPSYGQLKKWFNDSVTRFAVGMNFGNLELQENKHFSMGVYANVFGFTMTAEGITDASSIGEHQYGMGHVSDKPDYYEYLFGYQIPIFSNVHKKNAGMVVSVTPLFGSVTEAYYYTDLYYGQAVRANDSSRYSYGGMLSIRFGGLFGGQLNLKASKNGISGGFAFTIGKGFFFSNK